jgi:tRNA modification GTPase
MWSDDTIAAIATPLGEGGLAVVRLSGAQALEVADRVFVPQGHGRAKPSAAATHTVHYGRIVRQGAVVDEVLLAVMRAPRTYTREHVVEISSHGGLLVAKLVLDALLENGARLALPGEFTRRAFLNGRLDLAQAEAVADLIHSRTELALAAANEQLAGQLSRRINQVRDDLMRALAHIEAQIDFPDEDLSPDTRDRLVDQLQQAVAFMDGLLRTANEGQILRRGIRAAIIGRPNVGKSSLLNQLLGHDRAIVSHLPGTTRDTIEETANIRGIPVVFVDTAGLREAGDEIESEGIRRSRAALAKADLILHVLDASERVGAADELSLRGTARRKQIRVCNKADLPRRLELPARFRGTGAEEGSARAPSGTHSTQSGIDPPASGRDDGRLAPSAPRVVEVSCRTGQGIEALKEAIRNVIWAGEVKAEMLEVMINSRHQGALRRARAATLQTVEALNLGHSLELAAVDLRTAVNAIGEIVGKTTTEDLLDSIFSQFCIGK